MYNIYKETIEEYLRYSNEVAATKDSWYNEEPTWESILSTKEKEEDK